MQPNSVIKKSALIEFCQNVLQHYGVTPEAARCTAEVLVCADARGVPSHGVAHLPRHVADIRAGLTCVDTMPTCLTETQTLAVYDAQAGLGAASSCFGMNKAIDKARQCGVGVVSMRNSCHHGISGYYAMMAMREGMIGLAMTNTAALAVPTYGLQARVGTNPIAFAAPALQEVPFVLDMSTTVVTRGAIELCAKQNKNIPQGWAIDKMGVSPVCAMGFLEDLLNLDGGLLPLGGRDIAQGGHKGYGLGVMVDILTGVLSGGKFSTQVRDTKETASRVSHFFLALNIAGFRPLRSFQEDMDTLLSHLRKTKPQKGVKRVVYAGMLAHEREQQAEENGITLLPKVVQDLTNLGKGVGLNVPWVI